MTARDHRLAVEHNDRVYQAYLIGHAVRARKPQPISKFLRRISNAKPRQTIAQQIAIARMWSARGYGRVITHGG